MSINTTNGILDITGAVVRVSKMEFKQATGFDTVFNNIARNTILLSDSDTYETTTTYHNWALKLPNAWVFEADVYLASGTSGGGDHTFQLNFYNNVNTAITNGYTLGLDGTSLTLSYDGTQISTATLSASLNDDAWHKLFVLFERDTFAVAIDGKPEYTFTDSVLRDRVYNDDTGYVVFYHEAGVARKIKNLKFVNGDKWIRESGSSNIAYIGGSVGIGTDAPKHTLDVLGNANVGALTVTSVSGDGSGLSLIQSSNVSDFASNVTRIGTLETDLDSNVTRIGTLETDLESNVTRIGTLETDLGSNVTRIGTLETDLGSNVTRIGTLESGDLTIGGEKTFSSNIEVGTANLFVDTTTGNVGIGTTNPSDKLHIYGAPMVQHDTRRNLGTAAWYKIGTWDADGTEGSRLKVSLLGGSGYDANSRSRGGETIIYASINNNSPTTVANIDGIVESHGKPVTTSVKFKQVGTDRSKYEIHTYIASYTQHSMTVECSQTTTFTKEWVASSDPGAESATVSHAVFSTVVDNSGNVGIGTASPDSLGKLHVNGNVYVGNGNYLMSGYASTGDDQYFGKEYDGRIIAGMEIENTTLTGNFSQKLHLRTHHYATTEGRRFTIDESGNVGINTTNPQYRLDVNGVARLNNVAFAAYRSDGGTLDKAYTSTVVFNNEYFDQSSNYDTGTGLFTAPVAGIYHFSFNAYTNYAGGTSSRLFLYKNNGIYTQKGDEIDQHGNCIDVTIKLAANDTVSLRGSGTFPVYLYAAGGHNIFCGHLLTAV